MNTFELSLDLDKRAGVTQWVTLRQGDHDGTQLRATIYDHGTQVSDSYTCRVSIRKPTDNEYYRETCSFSGGIATVTIDEQYAASEVGITYGYFELLQGTAVIASTENFGVRILQSAIDGAIVAPPYDSAIEDALAELDEATGRISQMVVDATAEYLEAHPELTTTVEDNSLTDAKLIQSGGILSREQWLETMLPNIPRKATAEADVHSVTDSAGGGPLGIEVYGRSTQDGTPTPDAPVAIQSVEGNLLYLKDETVTNQGITTVTKDGVLRMSGTAATTYANVNSWTEQSGFKAGHVYTIALSKPIPHSFTVRFNTTKAETGSSDFVVYAGSRFMAFTATADYKWSRAFLSNPLAAGSVVDVDGLTYSVYEGDSAVATIPYGSAGLACDGKNQFAPIIGLYMGEGGVPYTTSINNFVSAPITCGSGVLTIVVEDKSGYAGSFYFACYSADGSYLGYADGANFNVITVPYRATVSLLAGTATARAYGYYNGGAWRLASGKVAVYDGSVGDGYQPHESVAIPIDLQGHALRSLPDDTRDEVNVDEWGHAILTQRVGSVTFDGTEAWVLDTSGTNPFIRLTISSHGANGGFPLLSNVLTFNGAISASNTTEGLSIIASGASLRVRKAPFTDTVDAWKAALATNPMEMLYPLATPVTIDLGYLDPALLPAPDLTAYVVPSAPSVLRYGFDVAAAIAEIATS